MSSIVNIFLFFIKVSVPAPLSHRDRFKSIGYVPVSDKNQTIPIPTDHTNADWSRNKFFSFLFFLSLSLPLSPSLPISLSLCLSDHTFLIRAMQMIPNCISLSRLTTPLSLRGSRIVSVIYPHG